jgi:hypothetical protein
MGNALRRPALVNVAHGNTVEDWTVIEAAVAFANGSDFRFIGPTGAESAATDHDRAELTRVLRLVVGGSQDEVLTEAFPVVARLFEGLKVRRTCVLRSDGSLVLGYHQAFSSARAVLDYAVALTLDATLPFGKLLCQCQWSDCAIFYIAQKNPKGGGFNWKYCIPEHRKAHHDSAQRKQESKIKKQATKKSRSSRSKAI